MKNIIKGCLLVFTLLMVLSGCSFSIDEKDRDHDRDHDRDRHGHPGPRRLIAIDSSWAGKGHGDLKLTMSSGEVYKGEYKTISWSETSSFFSKADYQKYYSAINISVGTQCQQFTVYGDKGAVIHGEYFTSALSKGHGYGLLKDDKGIISPISY